MAVIVLLFTFGTVVAMGLPIITALIGLVSGLSIITLISQVSEVPTVAPTLATMIGLGVGIDYALFIVTRHQAQRRDGMETRESIARAVATSGGAVVFAGMTVIVALLSLAVVEHPARHDAGLHVGDRRRWSRCPPRSRCCRRSSRGRRQDRPAGASPPPPQADDAARTAGRAGARSSPAIRCPARSSRSSCSSRSRCRRSTSTSASRTTARCRRAPRRARPTTA